MLVFDRITVISPIVYRSIYTLANRYPAYRPVKTQLLFELRSLAFVSGFTASKQLSSALEICYVITFRSTECATPDCV